MSFFAPSCTPTDPPLLPPQRLHLRPGSPHGVVVPAGSELFCTQGTLQLYSGPQGLVDGSIQLQWRLATGQRWRAPCLLWLQVVAESGPAQLQVHMATVAEPPTHTAGQPHPAASAPGSGWQRVRSWWHRRRGWWAQQAARPPQLPM